MGHDGVQITENNYPAIRPVRVMLHTKDFKIRLAPLERLMDPRLHPLPSCWLFPKDLEVSHVVTAGVVENTSLIDLSVISSYRSSGSCQAGLGR